MIKKAFVAATALSLVASPVLAQSSIPQPAAESVTSDNQIFGGERGSIIVPLIALLIVLGGVWLIVDDDDDGTPVSP